MRKINCFVMLLILLAVLLAACGGGSADAPGEQAAASNSQSTTTLMIYMVGSDLESKAGAATKDLEEIAASGLDLASNHVVIYAGGSPYWHNELTVSEENSILYLQPTGFERVWSEVTTSMGAADTLTNFLNYCVENYAADKYALIFWNHGNGPVMGFGKDMQHGNDALTLSEMLSAMQSSPFGAENKLQWVGFDACLMSSAELSYVWKDYADYLIASQEIEPSFGWDYSFLSMLGKQDTLSFLQNLTQKYYDACMSYFEKKGYDDRDTTLACFDLTQADALGEAIDALFSATEQDVNHRYQELVTSRINTRALGRASTGAEYDLIDLRSLANELSDLYPQQANAVMEAIERCVVINATNADDLSGVSLYYPFYNKDYYSNVWAEEYRTLNLFESYQRYLRNYESTWLGTNMLDDFASSQTPVAVAEGEYKLELTRDQQQNFASAKYYILRELAADTYTKVFTSNDVIYSNGALFANFDGDIIYAKNPYNDPWIPVTVEHDTVGDVTNFSTFLHLTNEPQDISAIEDYEYQSMFCRVWFTANKKEKEVKLNAILPAESLGTAIGEGKLEEVDFSDFTVCNFWESTYRTLKRNDNGVVLPFDEWHARTSASAMQWRIHDGLEFIYAPLSAGKYAIVFEIQDTQGNLYCSEPISFESTDTTDLFDHEEDSVSAVEWDDSGEVLLRKTEDYCLYLTEITDTWNHSFVLMLENFSDRPVTMTVQEAVYNDNIYCEDAVFGRITVEPGESNYYRYGVTFGTAVYSGAVKTLQNMLLKVDLCDALTRKTIWNESPILIDFSQTGGYPIPEAEFTATPILEQELLPIAQAVVPEQTILDADGFHVDLLCFGDNGEGELAGLLHAENRSGQTVYFAIDGFAFNDVFVSDFTDIELANGQQGYYEFTISDAEMEKAGITAVTDVKLVYRFANNSNVLWFGYGDLHWAALKLTQRAAAPSVFEMGDELLWQENGITIALKSFQTGSSFKWLLTVDNQSNEAISFDVATKQIDGVECDDTPYNFYLNNRNSSVGPKQRRVMEMTLYNRDGSATFSVKEITFRFVVMDFVRSRILFVSNEINTLKVK